MSTKNHLRIERLLIVLTHVLRQFTKTNIAAAYTATKMGTKHTCIPQKSTSMPLIMKCGCMQRALNFPQNYTRTFIL